MTSSEKFIKHANYCLVMLNDEVIGALTNIDIRYKSNDYSYQYIGGTEVHKGAKSIEGNFSGGLIDLNMLYKAIGSKEIDLRASNTILPFRFNLVIILNGEPDVECVERYYTQEILTVYYVALNNYNINITSGQYVLHDGSFMAEGIRIDRRVKQCTPITTEKG